jgi:hypothetical protein
MGFHPVAVVLQEITYKYTYTQTSTPLSNKTRHTNNKGHITHNEYKAEKKKK